MVHEAVNFDPVSRKWIFLPRRGMPWNALDLTHLVSIDEKYNADTEGVKGSNTILIADEDFSNVEIATVGKLDPTHGFSSFKFIPHRHHEIVALKSVETDDVVETCMWLLWAICWQRFRYNGVWYQHEESSVGRNSDWQRQVCNPDLQPT